MSRLWDTPAPRGLWMTPTVEERGKKWSEGGTWGRMAPPTLFLGEFAHSIDDKSRLAIPARFRPALQDGLVITRGLDRCLVIWDTETWRTQAERVRTLNPWQSDARRLQRHFFS